MCGKQSSDRGFGFHLPAGLLIKRNGKIWFGVTASAQNGNSRACRQIGKCGQIDGQIKWIREERRNWPIA
jgi:hypothetical protein